MFSPPGGMKQDASEELGWLCAAGAKSAEGKTPENQIVDNKNVADLGQAFYMADTALSTFVC